MPTRVIFTGGESIVIDADLVHVKDRLHRGVFAEFERIDGGGTARVFVNSAAVQWLEEVGDAKPTPAAPPPP
jgi:hypothetical protein